ncbi:MAG: amino acid adenylation domain-containing protein [Oscillospiraceae bacterium]|nr:amino acid adenylation domain-containing protein [Oscillospiraceae bacterium]
MSMEWIVSPVSMTELGIYLDWRKNPQGTAYNLPFLFPLPEGTDTERLHAALRDTLRAHPCVLSRFRMEADGSVKRLTPSGRPEELPVSIDESRGEPELSRLVRPFSDPEEPLYRLNILHGSERDYLFVDFHHILFDGSSTAVLIRELNRAYAGEAPLGEALSAADLARREQEARQTEAFTKAEAWYDALLSDAELCSAPIHDKESGEPKNAFLTLPLTVDAKALSDFVHGLGVKTSSFFTGVYGWLLSRFSGTEEALYASIHNGRSPETLNDIGMFVKTFPVLERFRDEESVAEHLKALDEQLRGSRENGLFSFADACSRFRLSVPTLFAYQGDLETKMEFLGGSLVPEVVQSDDPKDELLAEVFRSRGGYLLRLSYRTDLYEPESIASFAASFDKTVLEFLCRERFQEIDVTSKEQLALLDSFIPGQEPISGPNDVVSLFRAQAKKLPNAPALIIKDLTLSYGEIDEASDRIAWALRQRGIGRGGVVSVLIHRNEYMVIASLAVLKSGAAYQPLDPSYPPERLVFMVQDAAAALVIADEDLTGLLAGWDGEFLLTKEVPALPKLPAGETLPTPDGHDAFTLLYTSGSTGVPKGVILEHGNLVNFCRWYREAYGMTEGTVHGAYASYGFDANMMDLYPALTGGGCVCVVPEELRLNLPALGTYWAEHNVSVAFMTTQVGRQFAVSPYRPACLRALSVGGEKLAPTSPQQGLELYNVYGPTECTIFVTKKLVDRDYLRIPIGASFADAALYVVDKQGRRVPPCVPGELWIAGRGVGRGYLNRPEKNAESFTANPFCSEEGRDRVYHTGDTVRFLPNGEIDFIGRSDGQVKIRGFRIELSEIEAVIRDFPAVEDVTVQAFDNESGSGKYVAAYIVVKQGQSIAPGALESFIRQRKPPYMVPAVIMELDAIPLNQNQKVDKRRLPKPERKPAEEEHGADRELTALEQELMKLCAGVIGSTGFGVGTVLTDAGLTSISTMQLMVELEQTYGYSPEVSELLQGMRVLDIENALVAHWRGAKPAEEAPEAAPEEIRSAPLTQTQLGIYLECRMDETSDKYNIPFLLKLSRDTDAQRLAAAIRAAVEAHPAMKCSVEPSKTGGAEMIAHPELEWELPIEDSPLDGEALERQLRFESVVFKLARAPLFRFRLIRTADALYLHMVFHHILMDGSSVAVLMEDIERAWQGETLKPESYNGLQLALDEKQRRETDALAKAKAVYDGIFSGVSVASLPAPERAAPKEGTGRAAAAEHGLPDVTPERVLAFCKEHKLTENALFTAAFGYLLARMNGSDEALFASIYNGRTRTETLRIMGMLVKTYPIYLFADPNRNACDFIRDVQKRIQELTANDLYSFAEAVRDYDVNADVLFAYQGDAFTGFTVAGQKAAEIPQPFEDAKAPMSVDVWKKDGVYSVSFEYREDLFTEAQTRWMAELYGMILRGMLAGQTLKELKLLSPAGESFLREINATDWPVPFRPVRCLLEENAAKHPERMAVITPSVRVSYGELNESANRIAHALMALGAAGRIVSLMLPRCEYVYMVRQGILKAGAAFLSIDPSYPDERVRVMAEDSESAVLVVTEALLAERESFLRSLACPVVAVEELLKNPNPENPDLPVQPDDLAYCIFTSGSTGKPKGVLLTQRNLLNFLDANEKNPEILGYTERASVSLALAAITFDVSVMEEFIPLAHGMTVCMTTEEEIHNPAALARFMTENRVDMMSCTPSFLSNCIGLPVMKEALQNVKSYDFGAEAFPAALYGKILALNPEAYIMNGYGPTEATISCTMDQVTDPGMITIGRPASNVQAYILDEQGAILPPLVPGELVIAGDGVGLGYVARPELTAEKFFTLNGHKAYRTGDVAAWTSDGRLRFRGRTDNQVKLRGLRVELGEIESAINACPDVLTSIVVMTGEENNRFLAGYYTASRELDPAEVKAVISKTLTAYMVPGVLMQLPEMPLTQNGKIDKKRLPKVEYKPDLSAYVAPGNAVEADFCGWFAELLNLDKVSADGNFFELGGTSLSAAIIAMNAADKGYPIVYADVFKAQTPKALAALAAGEGQAADADAQDEIRSYDYSALDLSHNSADFLREIRRGEIGSILLAGASGFLGIHVLREYLHNYDGTAYCLLRGEQPLARLKELYYYYFEEPLDRWLDEGRVAVVPGDVTDAAAVAAAAQVPFDTCINCAALVKHFVKDDSLEQVNVRGVENLIALCEKTGRRLVQTSTVSVAGEGLDGEPPRDWCISERELYRGQLLDNAYIHSKFKAERAILEAVGRGLDAKIARLGNLMGRHSDGEFQVNFRSNAFIRSLASYKAIGAIPFSLLNAVTDFSEIDMTAEAILLLAGTDKAFTVFHPINNHTVTFADILYAMRAYGFDMETVEDEEFAQRMAQAGSAGGALIAYESKEGAERRYILGADCDFTTNALYRLGFKWPVTGETYIVQMLKALDELEMFEEDL